VLLTGCQTQHLLSRLCIMQPGFMSSYSCKRVVLNFTNSNCNVLQET
jgi:hypothetical protein